MLARVISLAPFSLSDNTALSAEGTRVHVDCKVQMPTPNIGAETTRFVRHAWSHHCMNSVVPWHALC